MRRCGKLVAGAFTFLTLAAVAFAQAPRAQLQQLVEQLQKAPDDDALRARVMRLGQNVRPVPALPDDANEALGRARILYETAKKPADYLDAAREYEKVIAAAPWGVNFYSDICMIYQKAGKYSEAKRHCDFALAGAADPALVAELKQRLAGLKLAIERFGSSDCNDCPEMVSIPAGRYRMGGTREITFARPFAVSKTEVTFAQWDACAAEGGCRHKPDDAGWGRGNQQVMNVNWDDAKQYVAWLSKKTGKPYRLLTEAEWEYAARAGTTTAYYWGNSDADICQYASVDKGRPGCGTGRPGPVGSRKPNAWGLYDMSGNVAEWVEDCWNDGIDSMPGDGAARMTGDCARRVLRGGSWGNLPVYARSANRKWLRTASRGIDLGFRLARTL